MIIIFMVLSLFFYFSMTYSAARTDRVTYWFEKTSTVMNHQSLESLEFLNIIRKEIVSINSFLSSLNSSMEWLLLVIVSMLLLQFVTVVVFLGGVTDGVSYAFYDIIFLCFEIFLLFAIFNSQHQYELKVSRLVIIFTQNCE